MSRKQHKVFTVRQQYTLLWNKHPLKPADFHRLEILMALMMHQKTRK